MTRGVYFSEIAVLYQKKVKEIAIKVGSFLDNAIGVFEIGYLVLQVSALN